MLLQRQVLIPKEDHLVGEPGLVDLLLDDGGERPAEIDAANLRTDDRVELLDRDLAQGPSRCDSSADVRSEALGVSQSRRPGESLGAWVPPEEIRARA